jgi:hypothetical protein
MGRALFISFLMVMLANLICYVIGFHSADQAIERAYFQGFALLGFGFGYGSDFVKKAKP